MKKKINLNYLLGKPIMEYEKFQKKIQVKRAIKPTPENKWPENWKKVYFKSYRRMEEIILPKPTIPSVPFKTVLYNRASTRTFSKKKLSLKQLSNLFFYSAGIKDKNSTFTANRFYPSGGARYPLEVYLLSQNTELPQGLYHYYIKNHSLEKLTEIKNLLLEKYFMYDFAKNASAFIIISGVFPRSTVKYSNSGYKYTLLEAGHLGQNIYLISSALNIACCALGGYVDMEVNRLIDIDGVNEAALYVFAIGINP